MRNAVRDDANNGGREFFEKAKAAEDNLRAYLAPLQAEIEHLRAGGALIVQHMNDYKKERDQLKAEAETLSETAMAQESMIEQLKARCDELEETFRKLQDVAQECERNASYCDSIAALSKPAASEQAPPLEIPSRTIMLSGCEFTEHELLARAVRAVSGSRRNTMPRWGLVRDAFGTGSGVATALCRRFGLDPDEVLKS
ncbi:Uncharacterized protein ALO87_00812 [Pseudomonas syringae pv. apii]|nr:Uncharacterized protein ALO87_00812 [Pseudomonas syringae pv. apii]